MQILLGFLMPERVSLHRRSTILNAAASMLDAAQSMLLLIAVTRVCGADQGGMLSISLAVAYQMVVIGRYGMRDFQATDIHEDFSFAAYVKSRIITSCMMLAFVAGYIFFNDYSLQKAGIMAAVSLYKAVDVVEDVYHGYYQRAGRLDSAALAQTIRYGTTIILYVTLLLITHDLLLSTIISASYSALIFVLLNKPLRTVFSAPALAKGQWPEVKKLLIQCAPLGICAFLQLFVINGPKYAIDVYLNDVAQTDYGAISMPLFAINLLSMSIYRPLLLNMAHLWHLSKFTELKKMMGKQFMFIAALTAAAMLLGYLWGIPVLSLLYGIDLSGYRKALMILIFGGGAAAVSGFMTSIIAVMRLQKRLMMGYGAAVLAELILAVVLVAKWGVTGASILFTVSMFLLAVITGTTVYGAIKRFIPQKREAA